MAPGIVRLHDGNRYGLLERSIDGLNTLSANHVPVANPEDDPRIVFVRSLSQSAGTAMHLGGLALEGESFSEVFPRSQIQRSVKTAIGLHAGMFYVPKDG